MKDVYMIQKGDNFTFFLVYEDYDFNLKEYITSSD